MMVECLFCGWQGENFEVYSKRQNSKCPKCESLERHRLLNLFLSQWMGRNKTLKLFYVSPTKYMKTFINSFTNISYIFSNFSEGFDLTDLPLKDNLFDLAICIHVLEHIQNDIQALKELFRVLKVGGKAIIQSALDNNLDKTKEYTKDEQEKDKDNHLRVYGNDYKEILEKVGFNVEVNKFAFNLDKDIILKCNPSIENIYICAKEN